MTLTIDHVTIAGFDLEALQQTFAGLGLATDYGGAHSNGLTHMALLGFDDGSYIELISSLEPGKISEKATFWGRHISGDGGPCAWAVRTDDVAAEAGRVTESGISVDGPHYYHRQRPDGLLVEWDLAFLDDKGAGAQLPFLIKDITPRGRRVRPSASVSGSDLTGIDVVVLGVHDLAVSTALFRRVYGWPAPEEAESPPFGARLAYFPDTPVLLAAPLTEQSWLTNRLARFGESPCAYLIGVPDFEAVRDKFQLVQPMDWFGRTIAWFDPAKLGGFYLGVVG